MIVTFHSYVLSLRICEFLLVCCTIQGKLRMSFYYVLSILHQILRFLIIPTIFASRSMLYFCLAVILST